MKKGLIILFSGIILLVFIFALVEYNKNSVKEVNLNNIKDVIEKNDYVLIRYGSVTKEFSSFAKKIKSEYRVKSYYTKLDKSSIEESLSIVLSDKNMLLFVDGEYKDSLDDTENNDYVSFFEKNIRNKIPASEQYYKVASSAKEYIDLVNSNKYTIGVIGYSGCTYCNLYLPVINNIAKEKKIDIYYFDSDNYDETEFQKIINLDFEIPAKCNTKGEVKTMTQGFAKPMTLITKNGKLVDCIKGYVSEDKVLDTLSKYKIVKEGSKKNGTK